ncbi:DUF2244 domain-containing protein [Oharaeibacter diazotrophicus]|uniref:Putative membrane protein n=2 Tax=Oharaeibacter diazotrophicus TaxID=1920512 RepID=A0A4R6RGD1_9HYPH|nr:DUF2244 domain-containing protein [Oharaeibacter diazotrophicus]TDP85491.1 putative membrane protein [Oharaeibacter diazotrophicus]BBE74461.1 hypothetical protein OHA_1_04092 [Pleomorphomonas sp. SM30]GLS75843.1 membrane protein [Oharaeibacter diazotrophicus]
MLHAPCGETAGARAPEPPLAQPLLDALITPHRSLDGRAFLLFAAAVVVVATVVALAFATSRHWPVAVFVAGDAIFLIAAVGGHRARRVGWERVVVERGRVVLASGDGRGREAPARSLPVFGLRVEHVVDPDYGSRALALVLRGERIVLAHALSPAERSAFCDALVAALAAAGGPTACREIRPAALLA